jgi:hypothetical protein
MAGSSSSRRKGTSVLVGWIVLDREESEAAGLREVAITVVRGRVRRRVVIAKPRPVGKGKTGRGGS